MIENDKRIKSDLAKVDAHVIQPHEYDEAPEWTKEDFDRAEFSIGGKVIRRGRPPLNLDEVKQSITLRLDPDVVKAFKRRGKGWQTRINTALRKAVRLDKPRKRA